VTAPGMVHTAAGGMPALLQACFVHPIHRKSGRRMLTDFRRGRHEVRGDVISPLFLPERAGAETGPKWIPYGQPWLAGGLIKIAPCPPEKIWQSRIRLYNDRKSPDDRAACRRGR